MVENKVIIALATAPMTAALAVIRVSGEGSIELVLTSSLETEPMMMSIRRMVNTNVNVHIRNIENADE